MSAIDYAARCADLLAAGVEVDSDGDVTGLNSHAFEAVELARALGLDLTALLDTQRWYYYPQHLLTLACPDEASVERECRLHAVWCARQVRHSWDDAGKATYRDALIVAWRHARGRATDEELAASRDAAWAVAEAAAEVARTVACAAAEVACAVARAAAWAIAEAARAAARDAARAARAAARAARADDAEAADCADVWDAAGDVQQQRLIARAVQLIGRAP